MKKKAICVLLLASVMSLSACGKKKTSPEKEAVDRGLRLEEQAQDAVDKYNNKLDDAEKYMNPEP